MWEGGITRKAGMMKRGGHDKIVGYDEGKLCKQGEKKRRGGRREMRKRWEKTTEGGELGDDRRE